MATPNSGRDTALSAGGSTTGRLVPESIERLDLRRESCDGDTGSRLAFGEDSIWSHALDRTLSESPDMLKERVPLGEFGADAAPFATDAVA